MLTPFDPAHPLRSGMSLPREVTRTDTGDRTSLSQQPVSLDGYRDVDAASTGVSAFAEGGDAGISALTVTPLHPTQ